MIYPDDFINKIVQGDCLEVLRSFEDESVDMCLTSPPYWGLRDYGVSQIFGGNSDCDHDRAMFKQHSGRGDCQKSGKYSEQEAIPDKVLSRNICLKCNAWLGQLGLEPTPELYIEHMTEIFSEVKRVLKKTGTLWLNIGDTYSGSGGAGGDYEKGGLKEGQPKYTQGKTTLKPKCLCMIPERLAWSLIQDGWILRNKIIWRKLNHMPSSVKDRLTNSYEFIYLFSQNKKYYFDLDSIREPHSFNRWSMSNEIGSQKAKQAAPGQTQHSWQRKGHSGYFDGEGNIMVHPLGKNPGDIFSVNTQPFPEAHFAVFPEKLIEKPIKAGCPKDGIVLDPFCGSGTTGVVAKKLGYNFIGIDIKDEYCKMAERRTAQVGHQTELDL